VRPEPFLHVVTPEEAARRWSEATGPLRARPERVPLADALGRVLLEDVKAPGDVPAFDRANLDGFAVRAADTFGAEDEAPRRLRLAREALVPGSPPRDEAVAGSATSIATGAVVPRGADAVVPVEHTDTSDGEVLVRRPAVPGGGVSAAGTDVARGETLLRAGDALTSRETGTLAACGIAEVVCAARPRVAVLSTGGELVPPGTPARPGSVHDANGRILSDAVREAGGEPLPVEIVPDDAARLRAAIEGALARADLVLVSGGTSKGGGDLVPGVVDALGPPGLVVHGVDVKPGKPLGLAVCRGVPVALLPGFPTSAVFTFHEVVAPLLRRLAGVPAGRREVVRARVPRRVTKERGRTEYLLVFLVEAPAGDGAPRWVAHPMGKGSGSVTAFARADGFVRVPGNVEHLERDEVVDVTLLGRDVRPADLVVVGSHCTGLDAVLGRLSRRGIVSKAAFVGSTAGLDAAARGECDAAPVHLLDPASGRWNAPFLPKGVSLLRGWRRRQGLCFRPGDPRFEGKGPKAAVAAALADPACRLASRNKGSGTRILLERLLEGAFPASTYGDARSHHAVAAAVAQGRADWGLCLESVARGAGLSSTFVAEESYDFAVPDARRGRPAVAAFAAALEDPSVHAELARLGFARP
jgi:putative molybdopterin biosynthesis protein